jgi:hypothetical protein
MSDGVMSDGMMADGVMPNGSEPTLPDLLADGLSVVFVGINPS